MLVVLVLVRCDLEGFPCGTSSRRVCAASQDLVPYHRGRRLVLFIMGPVHTAIQLGFTNIDILRALFSTLDLF